jgi:hypothetical protein
VKTTGAEIHVVKGGQGPPLLLLHGAHRPTSPGARRAAADEDYTLVIPDLRGYGDSSKPADTPDHINYSKRNMALDMVEVMKSVRLRSLPCRRPGSRRPRRPSAGVDHPDKITKLAVLDIVPTHYHYTHVTSTSPGLSALVQLPAAGAGAEKHLKAQNDAHAARAHDRCRKGVFRASTPTSPTCTACARTTARPRRST